MNNRIPTYAMFSPEGSAAVHGVVIALRHMGDIEARHYVIREMLKSLADSHKDFAEATDTAVLECVLDALDKE